MVKKTSSSNDRQVLLLISFGHSSCIGTQIADDIYCGRTNGIANRQINVKSDKQNTKLPIQWLPETVGQSENWLFKCFLMTLNAHNGIWTTTKEHVKECWIVWTKIIFLFYSSGLRLLLVLVWKVFFFIFFLNMMISCP